MQLQPTAEFNWQKVSWGGPNEVPTVTCSYCEAPLPDDCDPDYDIPLILWNEDGWCAQFCIECQRRYWGVEG